MDYLSFWISLVPHQFLYPFVLTYSCLYLIVYMRVLICFFTFISTQFIYWIVFSYLRTTFYLHMHLSFVYLSPIYLSTYFCTNFVLLIDLSTCFVCLVNGRVMQIGQKVWFEYGNVCGLCVLFVGAICMGFIYEFISDMTKVGWFHVWVHVRHQKGRSWGGGGRAYIYIYSGYLWVSYLQESLENAINTMGTLLGVHLIVPWINQLQ